MARNSANTIKIRNNDDLIIGCQFSTITTTGNTTHVSRSQISASTVGEGELQFFASYYSDESFIYQLEAATDVAFMGSMLYLGVFPYHQFHGVKFYITTCTISDGTHSYNIVRDNLLEIKILK